MPQQPDKWIDKCTSIKQSDPQYRNAQKIVQQTGCTKQNNQLTACLQKNKKDWRICKVPHLNSFIKLVHQNKQKMISITKLPGQIGIKIAN